MKVRRRNLTVRDSGPSVVVSALLSRLASGSLPGARNDKLKIGLALEGGGMRGVVVAGMVTALERLGLKNAFDVIYGTSAGAYAGSFYLADGAALGTSIFYENINNYDFIDVKRFFKLRPVLDLDFLTFRVMKRAKPLSWERFASRRVQMKIVCTAADLADKIVFDEFDNLDDLLNCLAGSANIPIIAGRARRHRGHELFDGGLLHQIPYRVALDDGCTHVLVLCSRHRTEREGPNGIGELFAAWYLGNCYGPQMRRILLDRKERINFDLETLASATWQTIDNRYVHSIFLPEKASRVARLEKRTGVLFNSAFAAFEEVLRTFGGGSHVPFRSFDFAPSYSAQTSLASVNEADTDISPAAQ